MQPVTTTITPRFYETDGLGHINNATIVAWFEVARMHFMGGLGEGADQAAEGWLVASVHVDYLAETFFGSDVSAMIVDADVGNTSLTLKGEMYQGGRQTMRGTAVMGHVDAAARKPSPVPDYYRDKITSLKQQGQDNG